MPIISVPDNLAFDSYTELTAAIAEWMDRTDLTGSVQSMIALAESRMRRVLNPLMAETAVSVAVTDGVGALPTDCAAPVLVRDSNNRTIPQVGPANGDDFAAGSLPAAWSIEADALRLWPACDATVSIIYRASLPQLSEANPTCALLSQFPDLYFFGAMMFAEGFVANDDRAVTFKSLFDEALAEAKAYFTRQRFAGPLVPRLSCP